MKKTMLFAGLMAGFALCAGAETDFAHHVIFNVSGYAGEALADFPVLVRLSSKIPGFSYSLFEKSDHSDLAFFAVDGETENECPYEIDTWNASGESLVWVKVPSLAKDKKLVARFGSQTASGNASAASVWSKYKAVWHMNPGAGDSVAGVSVTKKGSTSETSTDLLGAGYETTARGANSLATEYKFGNLSSSGVFTISGWFKHQYDNSYINRLFSTKTSAGDNGMEFIINKNGVFLVRGNGNNSQMSIPGVMASKSPDKGSWLHVAGVYNGTSCEAYANADSVGTGTIAAPSNYKTNLYIGNCGNGGNSANCYVGVMDEVRVYDGVASANWIAAEYASVSNSAFLAAGPLDDDSTAPSFDSAPTLVEETVGTATFSAVLATGVADVYAVVTDLITGESVRRLVAENATAGVPVSADFAVVNGHTYSCSVYAESESGLSASAAGSGVLRAGAVTPDVFVWGADSAGNWTEGPWIPSETTRTFPYVDGDTAVVSNATVTLDMDVALSRLDMRSSLIADGVAPRTITLVDSSDGLANINFYASQSVGNASALDDLVLNLSSPVRIYGAKGYTGSDRCYVRAKVSGGTQENPCDITLAKCGTQWHYTYLYLMNTANDWRGDIHIEGATKDNWHVSVCAGVGNSGNWSDGCFGDPANEIFFDGDNCKLYACRFTGDGLKRRIHGSGAIYGVSTETTWYSASRYALCLGNGFVADPCKQNSDYGRIYIEGQAITTHQDAEFDIDVGIVNDAPQNDVVAIDPSAASSFTGVLSVKSKTEIPVGTEFTVITVAKGAGSFAFEPSSVTPGWNTKCTGDADNGWRVVITKAREGADVANYPVSMIAADHVTVNCEVLNMGGAESITVRAYYGTTDGGDDPAAWSAFEEIPASAVGMYAKRIDGLDVDTTYYFRHAVMVGGVPVFSLDPAVSCQTVPVSHPDVFTWVAGSDAWMGTDVWSINTPYERHHPGYAGDAVKFVYDSSRTTQTVILSGDETVGSVTASGGDWDKRYAVTFTASSAADLVFDNLDDGSRLSVNCSGLNPLSIGASVTDALSLRLADDLVFYRSASHGFSANIYSKITGGTSSSPRSLTFYDDGNEWASCKYYVFNDNNDFAGDIALVKAHAGNSSGNDLMLFVGDNSHPYADSMLGDAANKVAIGRYCVLQVGAGTQSVTWSREVSGAGILKSVVPLALASSARFTADSTAAPLRITAAGAISDAAGTTYAVTIDADDTSVASRISFSATAPLALNGTFVVSQDDPTVKVEPGTRWAIGSVDKSVGALSHTRFAYSGDFRVYAEGDAENGWTIYAERKTDGLFIIMR